MLSVPFEKNLKPDCGFSPSGKEIPRNLYRYLQQINLISCKYFSIQNIPVELFCKENPSL